MKCTKNFDYINKLTGIKLNSIQENCLKYKTESGNPNDGLHIISLVFTYNDEEIIDENVTTNKK